MATEKLYLGFLFASVTLFFTCLLFGAFNGLSSWIVLAAGWMYLSKGWPYIIWLANPLLILCWALMPIFVSLSTINLSLAQARLFKGIIVALTLANLALALSFLLPLAIVTNPSSGTAHPVRNHNSGYWLWVASIGCMAVSGILVQPRRSR